MGGYAVMHAKILKCAYNLQSGAVTYMSQAGIAMSAEVPLVDEPLLGAVEDGTPVFQLTNSLGGLLGVQLSHPPCAQEFAAPHGVAEVHAPAVAGVHVAHGRCAPTFGHDRVGLAEQGFADEARVQALG